MLSVLTWNNPGRAPALAHRCSCRVGSRRTPGLGKTLSRQRKCTLVGGGEGCGQISHGCNLELLGSSPLFGGKGPVCQGYICCKLLLLSLSACKSVKLCNFFLVEHPRSIWFLNTILGFFACVGRSSTFHLLKGSSHF